MWQQRVEKVFRLDLLSEALGALVFGGLEVRATQDMWTWLERMEHL